jgi:hypothetical protein
MDTLFQTSPKNAWNAVIVQLLCWSFRRFCVEKLSSEEELTWDTYFDLITDYAPSQFQTHLDKWLAPEQIANVPNLSDVDGVFRSLVKQLDEAMAAETDDAQDALGKLLDEDLSPMIEKWLGPVYAPYSLFPSLTESDSEIDMTKLNAIVYLLSSRAKLRRKSIRAPVMNQMRKTRRNKENGALQLYVRSEPRVDGGARSETQNADSEGQKREGGEERAAEGERNSEGENVAANTEGSS